MSRFARQLNLVPPEKLAQEKILLIGAGAVGRNLGNTLAALGAKDVSIIDLDVVEDVKGKMHLYIDRIAGAQAKARFVREWSNPQEAGKKPILRAVLDSTQFIGADEEPPTVEELV